MASNPYLYHPCFHQQAYSYYWMVVNGHLNHQEYWVPQVHEPKIEEDLPIDKQTLSENPKPDKPIHKERNVKQGKILHDDQWSPQNKNRKGKGFNAWMQKEDRNAISNIIRSYLKFLVTNEAIQELQKLRLYLKTSVNISHLLQMMEKSNVNHRNYVRMKSVINMIKEDRKKNGQASKIFVMMFRKYAKTNLKIHFLTSSKLKQDNRSVVLTKIREVQQVFVNTLRQQQSVMPI